MIISIVNQKGGTAKTTTTLNLGSALTVLGSRVLLVDWDAQASLTYSLGTMEPAVSIADVVKGDCDTGDALIEAEGLHLLPSDIRLAEIEYSLSATKKPEYILKKILQPLSSGYDYILIDCPPSLSLLTINALTTSDQVIIPMQPDVLSLQGLELILDTIRKTQEVHNNNLNLLGVLVVQADFRRKLTREVLDYLDEHFDIPVFDTLIRINVKASEAPSFGQSVIKYAPASHSALDYMTFAKELSQNPG